MMAQASAADASRPNILLILADDLGAECLNSYGGTSYRTPNLDKLARTGLRFENCYATPLCSPSRVQIMTGRYGFRTGWTNLIDRDTPEFLDPGEFNFAHLLKGAGYRTAVAGKWQLAEFEKHPNHVNQCGFDEYRCWTWRLNGRRTDRYWNPVMWENGKPLRGKGNDYGEDLFCDFLIDFMRRNRTNAFFAYYPMVLVHAPFQHTPDNTSKARKGSRVANFPDMVAYMDKVVGRLVSALDELGLRENTLILFSGDNGTPREITSKASGRTIPGGKGSVSHVGAHVPLIANWKGTIRQARTVPALVDFCDFFPTFADLAQTGLTRSVDGRSLAPLFLGKPYKERDWVMVQLGNRRFVRDDQWLLHSDGRVFDITRDPLEAYNLAGKVNGRAKADIKKLQGVLRSLETSSGH